MSHYLLESFAHMLQAKCNVKRRHVDWDLLKPECPGCLRTFVTLTRVTTGYLRPSPRPCMTAALTEVGLCDAFTSNATTAGTTQHYGSPDHLLYSMRRASNTPLEVYVVRLKARS
jgi:hypothetical protein